MPFHCWKPHTPHPPGIAERWFHDTVEEIVLQESLGPYRREFDRHQVRIWESAI